MIIFFLLLLFAEIPHFISLANEPKKKTDFPCLMHQVVNDFYNV
jgi:hypothetical protein